MAEDVKSGIYIEFEGPGLVQFQHSYLGQVHPLQIIAACEWLLIENKQTMINALMNPKQKEQVESKILVPSDKLVTPS